MCTHPLPNAARSRAGLNKEAAWRWTALTASSYPSWALALGILDEQFLLQRTLFAGWPPWQLLSGSQGSYFSGTFYNIGYTSFSLAEVLSVFLGASGFTSTCHTCNQWYNWWLDILSPILLCGWILDGWEEAQKWILCPAHCACTQAIVGTETGKCFVNEWVNACMKHQKAVSSLTFFV